VLINGLSHQ
jgi:Ran GTPase-activating protein (RanGAP) involved in mRNA processing and transport